MDYFEITSCVYGGCIVLSIFFYLYKIHFWKYAWRKQKPFPNAPQDKRYAILVPARNESKVIRGLLDSIHHSTYNQNNLDTYVIVASKNDPTIDMCKEYERTECYCLPKPVNSKGATLQAQIRKMYKEGKRYDGYFIIDADNVLLDDFITNMHNAMCANYDLIMGCRLNKHNTGTYVNIGSQLTWTFLNSFNSKCRAANGQTVLVQGSPLLINKKIIEDFWNGDWPLVSLTEDLELMYTCMLNDFPSYYCEYAKVYDEQPSTASQSINQRLRWVKGHNQARLMYIKRVRRAKMKLNRGFYKYDTLCSLAPPGSIIATSILYSIFSLVVTIIFGVQKNNNWVYALIGFLGPILGIYICICVMTILGISSDYKNLALTKKQIFKAIFTHAAYLSFYVPVYFRSLFDKKVEWKRIDHDDDVDLE